MAARPHFLITCVSHHTLGFYSAMVARVYLQRHRDAKGTEPSSVEPNRPNDRSAGFELATPTKLEARSLDRRERGKQMGFRGEERIIRGLNFACMPRNWSKMTVNGRIMLGALRTYLNR